MAVTRTGSLTTITSTSNSSQSITVPSDAEIIVVGAGAYNGGATVINNLALTIAGSSLSKQRIDQISGGDATGLFYRVSPSTGSQTFAWTWGATPIFGGVLYVAFYKGINTSSPIRTSGGGGSLYATSINTGSMSSENGDGCFAVGVYADYNVTWTNATELDERTYNEMVVSCAEAFPSGSVTITTSLSSSNNIAMSCVVIAQAAAASGNPWYYYAQQLRSLKDKWRGLLTIPSLEEVKMYGRMRHDLV